MPTKPPQNNLAPHAERLRHVCHALFFFLFALAFSLSSFAATGTSTLPDVKTYDQLVHAIRQARTASRHRIEQAVEQEKVRKAWEIGKLIDEHVLQHKERADYGKQVLARLAKDLGTSQTELSFMLQFARAYPIYSASNKLTWSHYRELLSIEDPKERKRIEEEAVKGNWRHKRLREEIRKQQAAKKSPGEPAGVPPEARLWAQPGQVSTYRIVKAIAGEYKGRLVLDLGFSNYYKPGKKLKFQDRDIVTVEKGKLKKIKAGGETLFTYKAEVFQVIDGDTFYTVISLGFGFNTVQKLRLRGLDAPEIESAEGKEASEFVAKAFAQASNRVLIKTVKSDKYDRYLADVWVGETYLNQELIDKGLAVRVTE